MSLSRRHTLQVALGALGFVLGPYFAFASPSTARAERSVLEEVALIDEGFRVFTEETFRGNGRKCSTCHIPAANYSISPTEIDALSDEERALVFATNVPGLEDPALVSDLALFNTKGGFDNDHKRRDKEFRSSMTIAALDLSSSNENELFPGPLGPQLGWAGDGSPRDGIDHANHDAAADGSIRAFTNGAIAQHSTKRLARVAGVDFRFATDAELDALDAFQRWLGRRAAVNDSNEFALAQLTFSDERIEQGKQVFSSPQATCNACHTNGGSNFAGVNNVNLDTGVEHERERLSDETGVSIPEDEGGLNTPPATTVPIALGAFNIQSLIEAPRKRAFFHNSAVVGDIEAAATFYFTESFINAPSNIVPTHCASLECLDEVTPHALEKLGAFLRSLSAYYSIVDAERLLHEALDRLHAGASVQLPLLHAVFALRDVQYVLNGAHLSPRPYPNVAARMNELLNPLRAQLEPNPKECDVDQLLDVLHALRSLRAEIATFSKTPPADPT